MALTPRTSIREAARNAAAHRATTIILTLVALAMTAVTFLTAGRSAATEADILRSVDETGPRLITVTIEEPSPGIDHAGRLRLARIDGLEWILALGPAQDIRSAATGQRVGVASRALLTALPPEVTIDLGRPTRSGEALVGPQPQAALAMVEPAGAIVDGHTVRSVVGRFTSSGVIADLERLGLVHPESPELEHATLVYLVARDAEHVEGIVRQTRALAGVPADQIAVATADELVLLGQVLSGQVGALSRQLALGAIAVGLILVTLTMTLAVGTRRRDFGRRRALGATRSGIVALTVLEAAIPVLAGVLLGAAAGLAAVALWIGTIPPIGFIIGGTGLIAITGVAAAIPAAANAAWQDPLAILRVP